MKIFKYIPFIISLVLAFAACSDDDDKVFFNPGQTEPGTLNEISASYTLDPLTASSAFATFEWGKTLYNFDAAVTYTVEADFAGQNFANPQELASASALTVDVTTGTMNAAILRLATLYGFEGDNAIQAHSIEFRVRASAGNSDTYDYTNIITSSITPYAADVEYPSVHVMGDYSGWSWDNAQKVYDFDGDKVYEGWLFFDGKAANGFKFAIPTEEGGNLNWDNATNWGLQEGQTPEAEAASITLWSDGGSQNITAYSKNYYKFSFNTSTAQLNMLYSMDSFGIIGSGVGGWEPENDVDFDFDLEKQVFTAIVELAEGEIKFRADNDWALNFGQLKDGETGVLAEGGDNIPVTAGTYRITVDLNNGEEMSYRMEITEGLDPGRFTAPVLEDHADLSLYTSATDNITWSALDFGGQTPVTVLYTLQLALAGTDFVNPQTLGTARDATTLSVSGEQYLTALTALGGAIDTPADVDIRIVATLSGAEPINSNTVSYNLTVETPPVYPTQLFMTGSEFGNWFGDANGVVEMIPVNDVAGSFWTIRYFTAGQGFKWAPQMGWGNDFAQLAESVGYSFDGDGNAIVETSGLYTVYIDMSADKITIEPATIYGIGDAFGSWNMGDHPFTVTDNTANITTSADGNLRIYAGSSAATEAGIDWWRMEFILRDGVIEYRGNDGDQEAVAVTAGQTITLDFNAGTGSIQ